MFLKLSLQLRSVEKQTAMSTKTNKKGNKQMSISLDSIGKTKHSAPPRIVLHGTEGVGKSTFGAQMPKTIFIQTEDGLTGIDAQAFPVAKTFADVMQALEVLLTQEHDFESLSVDSLDWLERLIWNYVCDIENVKNIDDIGYGKGYAIATSYWLEFLSMLDRIRNERGLAICLICHSTISKFKSPDTEPYDRYELKLHKVSNAIIREWCDVLAFANWKVHTVTSDGKFGAKETRGVTTGVRQLHLVENAAWQAKNRFNLPETINLDYQEFINSFKNQ